MELCKTKSAFERFEVQLMLVCTQHCCWNLWSPRWQSVWYFLLFVIHSLSVHASFWPASLQPAAPRLLDIFGWWVLAMLVFWNLTDKSQATVTHFTLKMLVIMWLLRLHSSPTFSTPFGMSIYPAHVTANSPVAWGGWSHPRASSKHTGSRDSWDNDEICQIGGDCLPKKINSISPFSKCPKMTN